MAGVRGRWADPRSGVPLDELMDLVSELIARRSLWTAQAGSLKTIAYCRRTCRSRMLACLDRLHEAGLGRENRSPPRDCPGGCTRPAPPAGELAADLAVLGETAQAAAVPLADHGDALGRLTLQLWDELQAIRIVAIRGLFQRLARVAHDAARVEDRQVDVAMIGEADRAGPGRPGQGVRAAPARGSQRRGARDRTSRGSLGRRQVRRRPDHARGPARRQYPGHRGPGRRPGPGPRGDRGQGAEPGPACSPTRSPAPSGSIA